jgi:prepilin-type N-terminal cleavage/methylation domain-containing protein
MSRIRSAYTLVELLIAMAMFSMVSVGLFSFASVSLRMVGRNMATNHTHEVMRISDQELLYNLHASASAFQLMTFDGTNYADASPTVTTDQDPFTQQYISARTNGVRFRLQAEGPYQFTSVTDDPKNQVTTLTLDLNANYTGRFTPAIEIGDKLVIPLISHEYDITAVSIKGTTATITTSLLGFTLQPTVSGNFTTGYIYREVAYTVYNNQLRYHANFTGTSRSNYVLVRDKITSPKPFSVLFATATSPSSTALNLRISLEFYDTNYSAQKYNSGAATLQAIIPPRVQPTDVSSTNSS